MYADRLYWQVFLRAKNSAKADRLLDALARTLGEEIEVSERERYWKDETLFRATFTSPLRSTECAAAVLETLQVCSRVAGRWVVGAPQFYEGGRWDWHGIAVEDSIKQPGVAFIDFQVGRLEPLREPAEPPAVEGLG